MLEVDIDNPQEQRKFGLSTAAVLGVLGLLRFALHHFAHAPYLLWTLALVFFVLALVAPGALQPALRVAVPLAVKMNWLMTHVVLFVAFYLLITPSALLYRLLAGDPLHRKWDRAAQTYWEDAEAIPHTLDDYKNQF